MICAGPAYKFVVVQLHRNTLDSMSFGLVEDLVEALYRCSLPSVVFHNDRTQEQTFVHIRDLL